MGTKLDDKEVRHGDRAVFAYGYGIGKSLRQTLSTNPDMTRQQMAVEFSRLWAILQTGVAGALAPCMEGCEAGEVALAEACGEGGVTAIEEAKAMTPAAFDYRLSSAMESESFQLGNMSMQGAA